jgi:hypothetical protein
MFLDGPRRTKYVPMIEPMIATPPIASGSIMIEATSVASRNRIEASTMVATVVTA